jgi:hypothetical protein
VVLEENGEVEVESRKTQLLDVLRNRRRYWELKEEAVDRGGWRNMRKYII